MIREVTGGAICYDAPVNTLGLFIALIGAIIIWEVFWLFIRIR